MKKFKCIKRVQVKLSGNKLHIITHFKGGLVTYKTKTIR